MIFKSHSLHDARPHLWHHLLFLFVLACYVLPTQAQQSTTLYVGQSQIFSAPNPPIANAALYQTAWASRHASVSVQKYGSYGARVTVNSYFTGSAEIQCDYYYYTYVGNVQRTNHATTYYYVYCKGVECTVSPSSLILSPGEGASLNFSLSPSISPSPTIRWYSSNTNVATVSSSGYVYAQGSGSCTITCENSAGPNGTCSVTVRNVNPTGITLYGSSPIKIGQTVQFRAELYPSNAVTTCSWSSSNSSVASVNSTGGVTGKSVGSTRITVSTSNGLSDYYEVQVYKPVPASISFNESSKRVAVGTQQSLSVGVKPSDAIYTLSWESDASDIVEVTSQGRFTARQPGVAHITATTDNGCTATCTITVASQPTAVTVSPSSIELLSGRTASLTYSLTPSDAMILSGTWASADSRIASVSQSGIVTANKPGNTTVTLTTDNGTIGLANIVVPMPMYQLFINMKSGEKTGYLSTDAPSFSVEDDVVHFATTNLSFDILADMLDCFTLEQVLPEHPTDIALQDELKLGLGTSSRLLYTLTPQDAVTSVRWLNTDADVVSVTPEGVVTAMQTGSSLVTAQTSNGLRASCSIIVPEPQWRLFLWHKSGSVEAFDLFAHPDVTLEGTNLVMTTDATRIEYPLADISHFTMSDAAIYDPVEDIAVGVQELQQADASLRFKAGDITFDHLRANAQVRIFNQAGIQLGLAIADGDGHVRLSLRPFGKGIFIIQTESTTFKICQQ